MIIEYKAYLPKLYCILFCIIVSLLTYQYVMYYLIYCIAFSLIWNTCAKYNEYS